MGLLLDLLLRYQEEVPLRTRLWHFGKLVGLLLALATWMVATGYWTGALP